MNPVACTAGPHPCTTPLHHASRHRQRGSAMVEFVVIGPVLTLIGMGILQSILVFHSKNLIHHASYMAVRAGSMGNANLDTIEAAYTRALIPLYGGGRDAAELADAYTRAKRDTVGKVKFELLNPTAESFDDHSDPTLSAKYGASAIPNGGQAYKSAASIGANSGQNIQDANLLKVQITHGYKLKVPLVSKAITAMLDALEKQKSPDEQDTFARALYADGRIPIVTMATLQMQSDAIESDNTVQVAGSNATSSTGTDTGSGDNPKDAIKDPEPCTGHGCTNPITEPPPSCSIVNPDGTIDQRIKLAGDVNFDFDSAKLTPTGEANLDQMIEQANTYNYDSILIEGHTDNIGTAAYNLSLSQRRADAVKKYLQEHGITQPITAVGKGYSAPTCADMPPSDACRAANRRVEATLKNATQK